MTATYNHWFVFVSLLVAILASYGALHITTRVILARRAAAPAWRIAGACTVGVSIWSMHFGLIATHLPLPLEHNLPITVLSIVIAILVSAYALYVVGRDTATAGKLAASLKRANDELQRIALQDPLTKLPNRLLLEDRIEQAIVHAGRNKVHCAVLFLDLDRFKIVNDSVGHSVGDALLCAVAAKLQTVVRAEDTVSRLGGDEFVLLLREVVNIDDATNIASKIVEALHEPFRIAEHEFFVTPSVGVTVYPLHGDSAQMLITRADAAMYSAKQAGRNTFQVFAHDMSTFFPQRLTLENELRRAVAAQEFELHYQPKVNVRDGSLVGMEALVRWRHPERGLLPPRDFVSIAEDTGLINPIGRWIIERACAQSKAWRDAGFPQLCIGINISGVQFRHRDLLNTIAETLVATGLPPDSLELEITESVVMHNPSGAIVTLEKLSEMGVHVAIDDFGTGCSSLSYLKRLPIDRLKIDCSFVRDISSDPDDAAIVKATIALAHNLRLKVIAEGVETSEQLEFLRRLGCDEYQGFYNSRPLTAAQFQQVLRAEFGLPT
jgi:diguanylate cyclase (GGDEF)-like protein